MNFSDQKNVNLNSKIDVSYKKLKDAAFNLAQERACTIPSIEKDRDMKIIWQIKDLIEQLSMESSYYPDIDF